MFHTNSPPSRANVAESLGPLDENITVGGVSQTALKYEYGARFTSPEAPTVDTHPIGRGAMNALNGSCGSRSRSRRSGS
jgi:hypothetical protein